MLPNRATLTPRRLTAGLALALALTGAPSLTPLAAELAGEDAHPRIVVSATMSLTAVLEATYLHHPRTQTLSARQNQAQAWSTFGQSWLAGTPTALIRYQSDRLGSNDGLEEWESGFELPLWRWGQRTRVKDYSQELGVLADASGRALRWDLAGELRQIFWSMALAESRLRLAVRESQSDQELLMRVEKRFASGDTPQSEVLLAQTQALDSQSAALFAQARLIDEEWRYQSLTGLRYRPAFEPEVQAPAAGVPAQHPLLILADARVTEAQKRSRVVTDAANAAPRLLVGPHRQKAVDENGFDDSIGMTLSIPLGGARQAAVVRSAAELAAAQAMSQRDQQRRNLELNFHDAHHELEVTRERLEIAAASLEVTSRQAHMAQVSYQHGESSLVDLLRERRRFRMAEQQLEQLVLTESLLIAMYNQAVGVLP